MTTSDDRQVVEVQIGRPLRADSEVVARCHLGLPAVIKVPPVLDDGTPFPTLFWLTCPLAVTRIGRLEGAGGVKRMESRAESDPEFGSKLADANRTYAEERNALAGDAELLASGGVGGARDGIKCLHAHYAHAKADRPNPVGELVQQWIEPLDCEYPCVVGDAMNPNWVNRP